MPTSPTNPRRGYSLLELVLATALVGGTLVPAMALMRDGMELSRTTDERQLLANYAVRKLEERLAIIANAGASAWPTTASGASYSETPGDFAAEGFPSIRFTVTWDDTVAGGGLPNQLMQIEATTYIDQDNDDTLDAGEPRSVFRTKIAKLFTYESL